LARGIQCRAAHAKIVSFSWFLAGGGTADKQEGEQSRDKIQETHDVPVRKNGHPNDRRLQFKSIAKDWEADLAGF
jgi:hypothetical protein